MILENMVKPSLHVISLADNKLLKIGRGRECDLRIADVSLSRCHATIRLQGDQFVLEDHNSKFGTLIAMKLPRLLEPNNPISIQQGRTVLTLTLQAHPELEQTAMTPLSRLRKNRQKHDTDRLQIGANVQVKATGRHGVVQVGDRRPYYKVSFDDGAQPRAGWFQARDIKVDTVL